MKKIMILGAVALAAICSQASIVKWGASGTITFSGTTLAGQTVSLYIVGVGDGKDTLIDTRTTTNTALSKGKLSSTTGTAQASYDYNSTIAGGALWSSEGGDLGREYYMVITYSSGGKDYTYTSSAVASSGLSEKALGTVAFTFNDKIATSGKDAWVVAPEPTSGLLMLLGVAGLALRRRRA